MPVRAQAQFAAGANAPTPGSAEAIKASIAKFVFGLNGTEPFFVSGPCVHGFRSGFYGGTDWARDWAKKRGPSRLTIDESVITKLDQNSAQVLLRYHWQMPLFKSEPMQEVLDLYPEPEFITYGDKVWKIFPVTPEKSDTTRGLLQKVATELVEPEKALQNLSAQNSLENLRKLALAANGLTQDYDEAYAFSPRYTIEAVGPYLGFARDPNRDELIQQTFTVPGTTETYTFNARLSGVKYEAFKDRPHTVLFYEGQDEKPVFRYDGKAAIAFVDGHAALITKDEAEKLRWKP